jgi:DNA-binding NarL/FixJ family response regulator
LILNQPFSVNDKASGLEIVKYIKQIKSRYPVMILSGNNDEEVILKGFDLRFQIT